MLPDAPWRSRPGMAELIDALGGGEQTRFVGGAVRDTLLALPVSDIDLATRLEPAVVMDRLREAGIKPIPTGIAHGTVTAVSRGTPYEVTTLRRDVSTDGRRATVAFTDDWMEDAARRDFTINALFADPASGVVQDYFGGLDDLRAGLVRFIGDPLTRIAEDHLRMLRFFRFHARFGRGEPDAAGLAACAERANDLMALSRERIADELLKLLGLPDPVETVRLMTERGVFQPFLPEVDEAGIVRLARLVKREHATATAPHPLRRLAALLPPDPALAESLSARLRLPNKSARRLATAVKWRPDGEAAPHTIAYEIGTEGAIDRMLLSEEDDQAMAAKLDVLRDWKKPRLALRGGDLIAMGLVPGPIVAGTLREIEREWIARGFPSDEAVMTMARERVERALQRQ
ncbi:MAG TPA: CCA tRNA nucleotidyltransferase [Allosphingosinicella sp.]|jgi:poly(A) polymerase